MCTAEYKYKTCASFLSDFELIAKNAETFNGPTSDITKQAKKLFAEAKRLLEVEKTALGEGNDSFTIQENDIRVK
jgi:hypothetical protein